jgi:apolipoprotein D and lipocalin family protein
MLISFSFASYCQKNRNAETDSLQTVTNVDLLRYMGSWYEIALYPQSFEKGCECTKAEYYLHEGFVEVRNTCMKNGKIKKVKGKAFVVPNSGNAKLKVQFFWPFKGDYWIIALDKDYTWAVVSSPDKNYLWILSRAPKMETVLYEKIVYDLVNLGFDKNRIQKTKHGCNN